MHPVKRISEIFDFSVFRFGPVNLNLFVCHLNKRLPVLVWPKCAFHISRSQRFNRQQIQFYSRKNNNQKHNEKIAYHRNLSFFCVSVRVGQAELVRNLNYCLLKFDLVHFAFNKSKNFHHQKLSIVIKFYFTQELTSIRKIS